MPSPIAVIDLIASSMRLFGAIDAEENPTPAELRDGLRALNDMLENWSTETLSVWGAVNQSFATVPGQATYTIGPGGNFNTVRPVDVTGGYFTYSGVDSLVRPMGQDEYNGISMKSQAGQVAERMMYVNDYPLGRITLWPVPNNAGPLVLTIGRVLTTPVLITDQLTGPPGFAKAVRFCLAVEMAPEFGMEASPTVMAVAADAKGDYKRSNQTEVVASFDPAITGHCGEADSWRY